MIPLIFLILFTFSILYFSFGTYTLFKNLQSLKNRMFFSICIHLSCWALGYAFMTISPNMDSANFWRLVSAFGWCFTYSVWLDFTVLVKYESIEWMTNIKRLAIYIPGFFFFIGNLVYEPSKVMIKINHIWMNVYPIDFFECLYNLYYIIFVITGIVIIYKWGKNSQFKSEKKQSKIIVITSSMTFIIAAFTDTLLPLVGIDVFSYGIIAFSIALCGLCYAITKYKMMSITSKDANEYILRTIDDPVIIIGNDLLVKEINSAALEIIGYEENETIGIPIRSFISYIEHNQEAIQALLKLGGIKNIEVGLVTKYNNTVPCLLSGASINNDMNEIIGTACIFHNITERKNVEKMLIQANEELESKVFTRTSELEKINTLLKKEISERKRAEDELKSSEEKYRSLMKQSTDGILVIDPDTLEIIESNETVCSMLEYTDTELSNIAFERLFSTDRKEVLERVESIMDKKETIIKEISTINGKYGTIKSIEFSTTLVRYNNRQFIMVTLVDVTEKLIMEERKQQMVKMESLGTMAGGIAHDFNNILAGIIGYTQLSLEDAQEGFPIEDNLSEVLKLVERSKKLISKILAFSRNTIVEPHVVDMREIVRDILNMLKTTTPNSIEIEYNFEGYSANVLADPGEMQQLIMNLCVNAQLAMKNKGGILCVTLSEIVVEQDKNVQYQGIDEGKYVRIQVIDNGCGMEKSMLKKIFEPFYTTRAAQGGTGLGLSVVHGIVRRQGGLITVESKLNKGSTFTVLLPMADSSNDEAIDDEMIKNITPRILFVDNEESIVNTMVKLLHRDGYIVTGTLGGKEALKLFVENKDSFDIVITDQAMPDMTGNSLIEELGKIRPDIPVILCSGYNFYNDDETAKPKSISEFLLKPVSKLELVNAIEKVMQKRELAK